MSYVLESPSCGPLRAFCWVVVLPSGKADVTIHMHKATMFESKSKARRALSLPGVPPQITFAPVERP